MKSVLSKFAVAAATAVVWSGTVIAQNNPLYNVPGLGGYLGAQEFQQMQTLRQLQQIQEAQKVLLMQQQREALQQEMQQRRQQEQQQRQSQIEEIQATARRSVADRSKEVCVAVFVNNPAASETFARRGTTIGQVCSCVEQEMFALLTLDLSGKILVASSESAGDNQKFLGSPVGQEWLNRYTSASNVCIGQTIKKQ